MKSDTYYLAATTKAEDRRLAHLLAAGDQSGLARMLHELRTNAEEREARLKKYRDVDPVPVARCRQRKPSLATLIAKAKAAGASSVVVDGVEMRFGESTTSATPTTPDPWQAEIERMTKQ